MQSECPGENVFCRRILAAESRTAVFAETELLASEVLDLPCQMMCRSKRTITLR